MTRFFAALAMFMILSTGLSADEYRVTANALNVRNLPFIDAKIVGRVNRGDVLETTATSNLAGADWIGVRLPSGEEGFVSSRYVERVRVDRFNADFLQVLPEAPTDFIADLFKQKDAYGIRASARFAVPSSGRFLISFDRSSGELEIFDTTLLRTTRRIATHAYAVTDNYLVYVPQDGFTQLPHLEYIDLRVSDTVRRLDPQALGVREFIGVAAIPDSDRIVTQILDGNKYRIASLDLGRQALGPVYVDNALDGSGTVSIEFFAYDPSTVVGVRTPLGNGKNSATFYAVNHRNGSVVTGDLGRLTISRLIDATPMPEAGVVILQGSSSDGQFGTRTQAVSIEPVQPLSTPYAQSFHDDLRIDEQGRLVTYENRSSKNRVIVVLDPVTGQEVERISEPPNYAPAPVTMSALSNDGATEIVLRGVVGLSGLTEPLSLERIGADPAPPRALPFASRIMADLGVDGDVLRLLIGEGDAQAYFEWPLTAPEPDIALKVDPDLRWLSTASASGQHGAIFSTSSSFRSRIAFDTVATDMLENVTVEGSRPECNPETSFGPMARTSALFSDAGRFAATGAALVCMWSWEAQSARFEALLAPTGAIPASERSDRHGCDMRQAGCIMMPPSPPLDVRRLDDEGTLFWTFWATPGASAADRQWRGGVVAYDGPGQSPRRVSTFDFDAVTDFFQAPDTGGRFVPAPKADPIASRDGTIRMFVSGMRPGQNVLSTWLFSLNTDGSLASRPRLALANSTEFGAVQAAYSNGRHYVLSSTEKLAFFDADLSLVATRPFVATEDGTTFLPGGQMIGADHFVNALAANIFEVYRLADGKRASTFVVDARGNALALTDGGYFAQNARAAADLMILRNRDTGEALPIRSVFDTLYRPDLVQQALIGDPDNRVGDAERELSLESVMLSGGAPTIERIEVETDVVADAVSARMVAQLGSGGIGAVIWRVNNVVVGFDESLSAPFADNAGQRVELTRLLPLEVGENEITVEAVNHSGTITSKRLSAVVQRRAGGDVDDPTLFVMAVGVDDYENERLRLNYSVNDARAVVDALSRGGVGFDNVEVTTLLDRDVSPEALSGAFAEIAQRIRPTDTFVFFLAGHGVTYEGRYYFLPPNVTVDEDPSVSLQQYGISQNDWRKLFSRISALRSVILFDSCESGSAVRMNAVNELEQGAGISRLAESSGRAIITAAAETQYALEGHEGHGAFTYTILEALEEGDLDADDEIDLLELGTYVERKLPALTQRIWQYRQNPQVHIFGSPFYLAQVPEG